jgi:hypothetical protein
LRETVGELERQKARVGSSHYEPSELSGSLLPPPIGAVTRGALDSSCSVLVAASDCWVRSCS